MFYFIFNLPKNKYKNSQELKDKSNDNFCVCLNKDLESFGFLFHPLLMV